MLEEQEHLSEVLPRPSFQQVRKVLMKKNRGRGLELTALT